MLASETVLICVAPEAGADLYQFFERQFKGRGWEAHVIPVTDVGTVEPDEIAAVIAHASDWPDEKLAEWLTLIRSALGSRKRVLALLPRPGEHYPAGTQALWTHALSYGFKISQALEIVNDFLAGRA